MANFDLYVGNTEYDCGQHLIFRIKFVNEAQEALIFAMMEERFADTYRPGQMQPTFGDFNREEGWGWMHFPRFTLDYGEGIAYIKLPLICDEGDCELQLTTGIQPGVVDAAKELELGWVRFLPAKAILKPILEAA